MSLPKFDPNYEISTLRAAGDKFLAAGQEYWAEMHKAGLGGAVAWVEDSHKGLVIFTRGEYRDALLRNIPKIGSVHHFGAVSEE